MERRTHRSLRGVGGWVKRAVDVVVAGAGLVVAGPVMVGVAAVVAYDLGRPVLFRQRRPGLGGQPFELLKFRTMRAPKPGREVADDGERLTAVGRWLRRASLDELPTLLNVLRGEMTLVGPRPLLMQYLPRYSPEQARRHAVKPGVTGWAQVNGRNALDWETKFQYDVWYVDNWSLALDLKVLWRTVGVVLRREGTHYAGEATMGEFMGSAVAGGVGDQWPHQA